MTRTHEQSVAVGREKQAAGASHESWVETQHEKAMHLGIIAYVEKTQPQAEYIGGKLQYTKKSAADYVGALEPQPLWVDFNSYPPTVWELLRQLRLGGRALAVEAKSTTDDRLYKKVVSKKQQDHLNAVARAGGLALLVAEFRDKSSRPPTRRRFAVPWLSVPWAVAKSAESVTAEDLAKWAVVTDCYLQPFHPGGPRTSASGGRMRVFPRE